MKIIQINYFDDLKMFCSAFRLSEFKFQMVSEHSTPAQFQSGTRKFVYYFTL